MKCLKHKYNVVLKDIFCYIKIVKDLKIFFLIVLLFNRLLCAYYVFFSILLKNIIKTDTVFVRFNRNDEKCF